MMTPKVGEKLNILRNAAYPVCVASLEEIRNYSTNPSLLNIASDKQLNRQVYDAIAAQHPQAIEDEIAAAAAERRTTHSLAEIPNRKDYGDNYYYMGPGSPQRAILLAYPQIVAIVEAHNLATAERYEAYRVACEQRAAVEPAA